MSRVGKMPVKVLPGVKVEVKGGLVKVEGPKGKLSYEAPAGVLVKVDSGVVIVSQQEGLGSAGALSSLFLCLESLSL